MPCHAMPCHVHARARCLLRWCAGILSVPFAREHIEARPATASMLHVLCVRSAFEVEFGCRRNRHGSTHTHDGRPCVHQTGQDVDSLPGAMARRWYRGQGRERRWMWYRPKGYCPADSVAALAPIVPSKNNPVPSCRGPSTRTLHHTSTRPHVHPPPSRIPRNLLPPRGQKSLCVVLGL